MTPSWAATVTASGSTMGRGPPTRPMMRGPITTIPAEAPIDSWKPTAWTRKGSTITRPAVARARSRTALWG